MKGLFFGALYVLGAGAGLCVTLAIGAGLYNALYRFCPAFRHMIDRFYDGLPMSKWDR